MPRLWHHRTILGEMMLSLLLSAFLFAGLPMPATAVAPPAQPGGMALPTPQFRRYGTAEGLPSSSVYTVVQAPDGAMWFGTKGGIARYEIGRASCRERV